MLFLALALLILASVYIYRILGARSLIHPGFCFSASWALAIASYLAMDSLGFVTTYDTDLLNRLLLFVVITISCFLFLLSARRPLKQNSMDEVRTYARYGLPLYVFLMLFSSLGLLAALVNWIFVSGTLSYDDSVRQQWLQEIPQVTARMWYPYLTTFPSAFVSGLLIAPHLMRRTQFRRFHLLILPIPFLSGFFWMLGTGARQTLGFVILYYLFGMAFGAYQSIQESTFSLRQLFRVVGVTLIFATTLLLITGVTAKTRALQQRSIFSRFYEEYPYVSLCLPFIQYMGLSLASSQAYGSPEPRDLTETGPVSLAGLLEFGPRQILGLRPVTPLDTNPERQLAVRGLPLAFATRNIYYDFEADFGFGGAIAVVVSLAVLSHMIFNWSSTVNPSKVTSLVPLTMASMFWAYSHQFSLLMFDVLKWMLVSFFMWDVLSRFFFAVFILRPSSIDTLSGTSVTNQEQGTNRSIV